MSGHSKSTFVMEEAGGKEVLKKRTKTNRGRGLSLSVFTLFEKFLDFSNSKQFFLISCLIVAKGFSVLSLVQTIKRFFY